MRDCGCKSHAIVLPEGAFKRWASLNTPYDSLMVVRARRQSMLHYRMLPCVFASGSPTTM